MARVRVKFCGITSSSDAEKAVRSGADAIGFIFFKDSPRYVTPERAGEMIEDLPPFISTVGVFVNEDLGFIGECVEKCGLDAVQLHGDEDVGYCLKFKNLRFKNIKLIKAIRVKDKRSLHLMEECPADAFLLDAYKSNIYGGTGEGFDKSLAVLAKGYGKNLIISGGLNPRNVYDVITKVRPYGVDASSGVESMPGKKNVELMGKFIKEVYRASKIGASEAEP